MEFVATQEFSIARASFMLTHRVSGDDFDFMTMMHEALDLDFSKVLCNVALLAIQTARLYAARTPRLLL